MIIGERSKSIFKLKRAVIEIPLSSHRETPPLLSIRSLHMLQHGNDSYAGIFRIELQGEIVNFKRLLQSAGFSKVEILYQEKDGALFAYLSGKHDRFIRNILDPIAKSCQVYCLDSFEVNNGKLKVIYIGKGVDMARFLKKLSKSSIPHKLLSLMDARFSSDSSFYALTEKQREMLTTAFRLGYFKVPRAITSRQLAKKFKLSSSAVSERLRNAEQRLLTHSLNE